MAAITQDERNRRQGWVEIKIEGNRPKKSAGGHHCGLSDSGLNWGRLVDKLARHPGMDKALSRNLGQSRSLDQEALRGFQARPCEMEQVLVSHRAISEVGIAGIPNP
ncbi:MAG TPA: hypothetical protein VMZ24_01290 [Patescibacteria group bacterium]|nr:hypothetical protein [Patescibacteria group bacterium]